MKDVRYTGFDGRSKGEEWATGGGEEGVEVERHQRRLVGFIFPVTQQGRSSEGGVCLMRIRVKFAEK